MVKQPNYVMWAPPALACVRREARARKRHAYETCAPRGRPGSAIRRRSAIRSIGENVAERLGGCSEAAAETATHTGAWRHPDVAASPPSTLDFSESPLVPTAPLTTLRRFPPAVPREGRTHVHLLRFTSVRDTERPATREPRLLQGEMTMARYLVTTHRPSGRRFPSVWL
ncbi:hypothetical protein KM043_013514 [Ampulex compressa]|nr:hypothetical protein KM043_013514 [Ampulex compressa]